MIYENFLTTFTVNGRTVRSKHYSSINGSQERSPEAAITRNKSRKKVHNEALGKVVYMKKGENFEIELFNPNSFKVLAVIDMNGKNDSSRGIILRPGERVFLERHLGVSKKFVFDTYEVSDPSENRAVADAIRCNGDISIYFYAEKLETYKYTFGYPNGYLKTNGINDSLMNTMSLDDSFIGNFMSYTSSANDVSYSSASANTDELLLKSLKSKKTVETGRVEAGDASDQKLVAGTGDFDMMAAFSYVTFKLLPESNRPVESKDLHAKKYCTNCGKKAKTKDKFCSSCGTKLD